MLKLELQMLLRQITPGPVAFSLANETADAADRPPAVACHVLQSVPSRSLASHEARWHASDAYLPGDRIADEQARSCY
jgi:hypothetical protein